MTGKPSTANLIRRGIYNTDYYSGAQVSLYIGDIWVDEITTLSYGYQQNRSPIYGYASTLYDGMSRGQVLVQGTFTINFKEAGYLWLILNRYKDLMSGVSTKLQNAWSSSDSVRRLNIERLIQGEGTVFQRNEQLKRISDTIAKDKPGDKENTALRKRTAVGLGGFSSNVRGLSGNVSKLDGGMGDAETVWEIFEDIVWGTPEGQSAVGFTSEEKTIANRRADDPVLNPFDIYVAFGDFAGDNSVNHTIERINRVTILGKSKQIVIDGLAIQEQYSFIARELI